MGDAPNTAAVAYYARNRAGGHLSRPGSREENG
jgi:hypothetical protein